MGLYRGISSNIASSAPISAIYTFTYESVKSTLVPFFPKVKNLFCIMEERQLNQSRIGNVNLF